jgi:arginine deiminase
MDSFSKTSQNRSSETEDIENYPLERYPDYLPNKPPQSYILHKISYLEEMERTWGRKWGAQGIGKLREVGLVKPMDIEANPLWARDPRFFLLRHGPIDKKMLELLRAQHQEYADLLKQNGVNINWIDIPSHMGPYGPMRKLYVAKFCCIVRGGAIISRAGQSSYRKGWEPHVMRFLAKIGCPVLLTISGYGIYETGVIVPLAEDVLLGYNSCAANQDALEQMLPVLNRAGVKEFHTAYMPTLAETFDGWAEFHVDMSVAPVDLGIALVYPPCLDFQTYAWLKDKGFKLIEIPPDEQRSFAPANLVILEPGKVIMAAGAKKTISAVRNEGIDVIELDTSAIRQGGTNGISCMTMHLLRDNGPSLEELGH